MTSDPWLLEAEKMADEAAKRFREFVMTVAHLRHPTQGCPWDREQTHATLQKYMLEEAYEATEAMRSGVPAKIADELGDVLLQVVLNSQLGADAKTFNLSDVIGHIDAKMKRRHPHVFAPDATHQGITASGVKQNWQEIKAQERGEQRQKVGVKGVFADVEKKVFPSTIQARRIGEIARQIDFDWDHAMEVFHHMKSEIAELEHELNQSPLPQSKVEDELGDVYFTLAHLCRHLGIEPEIIAHAGNLKFLRRFAEVEKLAQEKGIDLTQTDRVTKENLWIEAKKKPSRS